MITCIVIDDEPHAIEILKSFINRTPGLILIQEFDNPLNAINFLTTESESIDITFADVDMPQLSGVELAGIVKNYTSVIITTAFTDYAYSAFVNDVADYLLKPMTYDRFLQSVIKVKKNLKKSAEDSTSSSGYGYVKCESKGKKVRIDFNEIYYIESLKNYIVIYLENEKHITYLTMKEMEEYLPTSDFSRVHKSIIVNHQKIRFIDGNNLIFVDKRVVTMGQVYKENLLNKINFIISKRNNE